jgi:hypothetical protein
MTTEEIEQVMLLKRISGNNRTSSIRNRNKHSNSKMVGASPRKSHTLSNLCNLFFLRY